jgi:hypothetical protein
VGPVGSLPAEIFVTEVQCPSFATIHFNQREVIKRTHDLAGVGWGRRKGSQVADTNVIFVSNLQDLVRHLSAGGGRGREGGEVRGEEREEGPFSHEGLDSSGRVVAELTLAINNGTRDDLDNIKQGRRGSCVANLFLGHWAQFRSPNETPDHRPVWTILSLDSPLYLLEVIRIDWLLGIHVIWNLRREGDIQTIQGGVDCKQVLANEMINEGCGKEETIQ